MTTLAMMPAKARSLPLDSDTIAWSWADHARPHPDNQRQRLNALLYLEQLGKATVGESAPISELPRREFAQK